MARNEEYICQKRSFAILFSLLIITIEEIQLSAKTQDRGSLLLCHPSPIPISISISSFITSPISLVKAVVSAIAKSGPTPALYSYVAWRASEAPSPAVTP